MAKLSDQRMSEEKRKQNVVFEKTNYITKYQKTRIYLEGKFKGKHVDFYMSTCKF